LSGEAPAPPPRGALLFIFAAVFLDLLGAGLLLPIIPYYVRQFDQDALTVGLLALSFAAAQFLATPALGLVSDRIGRRPVLIFSVLGSGLAYLVFGMAHALWLLFVARIADGLTGGNISTAQAYIADVTSPRDRAKNMGLIGAAFGMGFIFGPALGGLLARISLQAPAFAAGGLSLLTAGFGYFVLPESLPAERRRGEPIRLRELNPAKQIGVALRRPELRPFLLALFALNFALSGLQTNFPVFTLTRFGLGPEQNALIFTFLGVTAALMQGVAIRRLVKWFRAKPLAVAGLGLMAGGLLVLAFSSALWMVYAAVATTAIGSGMAAPTLTGAVSRSVSALEQGTILGTSQSFTSLTRIFGPLWAGLAFDHAGPGAPYWTSAVVVFGAMAVIATAAGPDAVKR
jgi:MFS transporter, DHA1 family, tetracycline resistance protein